MIRACVAQAGSLRVIPTGANCRNGERLLLLRSAGDKVTEEAPAAFASRTGKARPIRNRWTAVTSNALTKGSYLVHGAVRIDHRGPVAQDVRLRCGLRRAPGKMVRGSVVAATFEKGDAGDLALPISATIDRMRAGRLSLVCEELPRGGRRAKAVAAGGPGGSTAGSPGVLSGNIVEVPVRIPVNVCGNTVAPVGTLDPSTGNTCVNEK